MKEVELLKDIGKHRKGDKVTIPKGMANYWKRMGVAKDYVKPKAKPKKEKNTDKSKEKSNDKSGTTNKSKGKS